MRFARNKTEQLCEISDSDSDFSPERANPWRPGYQSGKVVSFRWNNHTCQGTELHQRVLNSDAESLAVARQILEEDPAALEAVFRYYDFPMGRVQERTGQAIHLAASRGNVEMVELLVDRRASLSAYANRDGKRHYNVLMAAVFAEGRRGNTKMVKHLLEKKAPLEPNSDGLWPLHLAFQAGKVKMIPILVHAMKQECMMDRMQQTSDKPPLLLGIQTGKMTTRQLARAAESTPESLRLFLQHEPTCIPEFLAHVLDDLGVRKMKVAGEIGGSDLVGLIRRHPAAACALFAGITDTPDREHEARHPLPQRASFAATTRLQWLRRLLNPTTQVLAYYEVDCTWKFDKHYATPPPWHSKIPSAVCGAPVHDVDIKICYVPNILCAEYFAALVASDPECVSALFEDSVVCGSVEYVWWLYSWRPELLHVLWSLWAVSLWIVELYIPPVEDHIPGASTSSAPRQMRSSHGGTDDDSALSVAEAFARDIPTSAAYIGTTGVVTLLHEIILLAGLVRVKCGLDYLTFDCLYPLLRSAVQAMFFFKHRWRGMQQLAILFSWMSLLETFAIAESLAVSMLPIKRLVWSLGPPILMTVIAFGCGMHMLHNLWGHCDWQDTFLKSFAILFTADVPNNPLVLVTSEVLVTYSAVLIFSVFLLNIFIGIIGTQYEVERLKTSKSFQQMRAERCRNFLVRAQALPCSICSENSAAAVSCAAILLTLALQVATLTRSQEPQVLEHPLLIAGTLCSCQLLLLFAAYQNPSAFWTRAAARAAHKRFLWLAVPRSSGESSQDAARAEEGPLARGAQEWSLTVSAWNVKRQRSGATTPFRVPAL